MGGRPVRAAVGFLLAAVVIQIYIFVPMLVSVLKFTGLAYGIVLSAIVVWVPWMPELYPPHLRSTAASISSWGRLFSMSAPLITPPLAETYGLALVMSLVSISFVIAALIWLSLPETLVRPQRQAAGALG